MNVSPPTFTRRNRNLPSAFYDDMVALVLDRFEAPYSDVSMACYQNVVMDVWQTQKWFEPLQLLMHGRSYSTARQLKKRVRIKVGEFIETRNRRENVRVERNIYKREDVKSGNITYEAGIRDPKSGKRNHVKGGGILVSASFKSLDAARGWLTLAKQYKSEGRPVTEVPRETWHIERLEELGREAANK